MGRTPSRIGRKRHRLPGSMGISSSTKAAFILFSSELERRRSRSGRTFLFVEEKFGGAGFETFDNVVGDGVHQLDDIAFAKQFAAEAVAGARLHGGADWLRRPRAECEMKAGCR